MTPICPAFYLLLPGPFWHSLCHTALGLKSQWLCAIPGFSPSHFCHFCYSVVFERLWLLNAATGFGQREGGAIAAAGQHKFEAVVLSESH